MIEIKRHDGRVLFSGEYATVGEAVVAGVSACANLSGANLSGANLGGADLRGADLSGANLGDTKIAAGNAVIQIGPIGSRNDTMIVFDTDDGLRVRTGCFYGTSDDFLDRVRGTHGETAHGDNYRNALAFAASVFGIVGGESAKEAA